MNQPSTSSQSNAQTLLDRALELHGAGQLEEAVAAYEAVLAVDPRDVNALTNLGLVHLYRNQHAECIRYTEQSLAIYAKQPQALVDLGDAYQHLGQLEKALGAYEKSAALMPDFTLAHERRARCYVDLGRHMEATVACGCILALDPNSRFAYNILSFALYASGHSEEAIVSYEKLLELEPPSAELLSDLGVALTSLKRYEEALARYDQAIALNPNMSAVHNNRGNVLKDMKRYDEALVSYDRAVTLFHDYAEAHNNRALALNNLERYDEALKSVDAAIALRPEFAEAYNNRGIILKGLKRYDDALKSFEQALALKPNVSGALSNRGVLLGDLDRHEEALADHSRAIEINPDMPEAYNNYGIALRGMKRFDEAFDIYEKAIAIQPDYGDVYWNKAILELLLGNFKDGWKNYEWRWKTALMAKHYRSLPEPLWLGQSSLAGKTILIHPEQGLGDAIQFCRFVPMLEAMGAHVVLETFPTLGGLLATVSPSATIITKGSRIPHYDVHCPIMSLPHALGITLENLPNKTPYLTVDPKKRAQWQARLGEKKALRVGLAWSGSAEHTNDASRSIPLALLAPLFDQPVEFHAIQKDLRERDKPALAGPCRMITHGEHLQDFNDTAALVEAMDLVISVDTSLAHLAGALAKPFWLLLPYMPDYRWMLDREDSPWYPTAKLFRQRDGEAGWPATIARVATALQDFKPAVTAAAPAVDFEHAVMARMEQNAYADVIALVEPHRDTASVALLTALAQSYAKLARHAEAVATYDRILTRAPTATGIHSERANVLSTLRRFAEALAGLDRALALAPADATLHTNRANTLRELGRLAEAMAAYDRAIALDATLADAYWNKSTLLLLEGTFTEGWEMAEWRWKSRMLNKTPRALDAPLWLGDAPLAGKTLLIHPEQGYGDFIMCARYVPRLMAAGAQVVLETPPPLVALMRTLAPNVTLVEAGSRLPPIDLHCPIMSLPHALRTTQQTIPATIPYLTAEAENIAAWAKILGDKTRPRIGIAWSGSTTHIRDRDRSIALETLLPLLELPFGFYSLQKELRPSDKAALGRAHALEHHAERLTDFAQTAGLIGQMDLVISVDTSVAHLAGAMGKPVWILLPTMPDYRWMLGRDDSPWYPTARLFRQKQGENWANVIESVMKTLQSPASGMGFASGSV